MPFARFPSNFVYWFNVEPEKHAKIKQMLLPKIELDYSRNSKTSKEYFMSGANTVTNFSENPSYMADEFITKTIVWDPIDEMIKSNNEKTNELLRFFNSSWPCDIVSFKPNIKMFSEALPKNIQWHLGNYSFSIFSILLTKISHIIILFQIKFLFQMPA